MKDSLNTIVTGCAAIAATEIVPQAIESQDVGTIVQILIGVLTVFRLVVGLFKKKNNENVN